MQDLVISDYSVLIVEDIVENQVLLKAFCDEIGIPCEIANNGKEALEILEQQHFSIYIVDLMMQVMDGKTFITMVKKKYPDAIILVQTALDSPSTIIEIMKLGIFDYIIKPLVFEPFTQISDSSLSNRGGSGLGLTISRSLANLMGGSIRVESLEGVGSTFHFLVQLQKKIGPLEVKPLHEKERSLWSGPVLNILLAEDDPVNAGLIKTFLGNMGHAITIAENGKVALDSLQSNAFDVALMDIQMPVMSGTDVLSVIREQEKMTGKHLTMIAFTANAFVGDKEKYLKMGFDGYLSKPFRTNELIDEVRRVIPT